MENKINIFGSGELSGKLPPIRRARGYRLYDNTGRRYLDFFQNGGTAVLGHRPTKLSLTLKDTIEKGLYGEYPNLYQKRLLKHLNICFPNYNRIEIFRNRERAVASLKGELPADPLFIEKNGDIPPIQWGRPFFKNIDAEILLPIIPFPGFCEVQPVLYKNPMTGEDHSDIISPVLAAGICRILSDLVKSTEPADHPLFSVFDQSPYWERKGIYLIPRYSEEEYRVFFEKAMNSGIFFSPSPMIPSVIPLEISDFEAGIVKKLL